MPDVTISLTAAQAQRVQAALATPENPTPGIPVLKQWLVKHLRAHVLQYERRVAEAAVQTAPFDPT